MTYDGQKEYTPPPRVEIPMPRVVRNGNREYIEFPNGTSQLLPPRSALRAEYKWANTLWPAMTWMLFIFHVVIVGAFFIELFRGEYDLVKHVTIVATICGSYAAIAFIHNHIVRNYEDGRFD